MVGRLEKPRDYEAERRRNRLLIGVALLVVLLAVIAYFAFRSDGEDTRATYCTKLQQYTKADGLQQTLRASSQSVLHAMTALAPGSVSTAWNDASKYVLDKGSGSGPRGAAAAKFESDMEVIKQDAADNCSLQISR